MKTEEYEKAYVTLNNKHGIPKIEVGKFRYRPSTGILLKSATIEYHDGFIILHGYKKESAWHHNDSGFMNLDITAQADKFCIPESAWYYYKPWYSFGKPKRYLKPGFYEFKTFDEIMIVFTEYTIINHR